MDLTGLIPSFGNLAMTLAAFLVALTIIVFIHEMGHYLVGRWSGIKADVFSIGAGPVLVSRTDRHGTRWQIAAFPVGGYVKFHGDSNAASGTADAAAMQSMSAAEQRATLHGAPLWARAATVAAGPLANFILSVAIFTAVALSTGVASEPLTVAAPKAIAGVEGVLQPGDEVIAIAGLPMASTEHYGAALAGLPDESPLDWTLRRDGAEIHVRALHPFPPLAGAISPQSAAADAGLEPDDLITAVDGTAIATFEQLRQIVAASDGKPLALSLTRAGAPLEVTLTPRRVDLPKDDGSFETRWLIGVVAGATFEPATRTPGLGEALTSGADNVIYIVKSSISGLWHMVTGSISSCNLRGPIGIAETSGAAAQQGLASFIWFIAVLSTAVGLLNLFPIPVLDGGHLMFHAWEAITRRPPSQRALSALTLAGLVLVLGIMALGVTNDLFCP